MGNCCNTDPLNYYEMEDRSFGGSSKVSVCILTWDVGGKSPKDDIVPLLKLDGVTQHQPDIFVIGLQDTATNKQRFIGSNRNKMGKWEEKIESILSWNNESEKVMKHKYVKLESVGCFGMLSIIFVSNHNKELFSETKKGISNVQTSKVSSALMGKGALGIHFTLFGKRFNFVNVHFASHQGRNTITAKMDDYDKLMNKMKIFDKNDPDNSAGVMLESLILDNGARNPQNRDIIFVYGDFNYRINVNLENRKDADGSKDQDYSVDDFNHVVTLMNGGNYYKLMRLDELGFEMKRNNVFRGFCEERIRFPPTYKYKTGRESELNDKKIPSYPDRILWKISQTIEKEGKVKVNCLKYQSQMEQNLSDHKPVVGLFTIDY